MIRGLFPFLLILASPVLAAPTCPTKANAISPGIQIKFRYEPPSQFTVTKDGMVIEDVMDGKIWRYETLGNVFILRWGPMENGTLVSDEMEVAHYQVPVDSLPAITDGIEWRGHVSYTNVGKPAWETDMAVSVTGNPELRIGECRYKSITLAIRETDEDGTFTTFLAFLPELGVGVRVGLFADSQLDTFVPVSIGLIGDE